MLADETSASQTHQEQEYQTSEAQQMQSFGMSEAPKTNVGAIPAPDSPGFLDRALKDPEFYAANRDKVRAAWNSRNKRQS